MNFCWSTWIVLFILDQERIPYIIESEFYDQGLSENLIEVIVRENKIA